MAMTASSVPTTIRVGVPSRWTRACEALRYLSASIAALAVDASVLWGLMTSSALPVWLAGGVAYLCGLVLIYFLSVRWVFAARSATSRGTEFMLFALLGVIGLLVNSATLSIATSMGVALALAKAMSAVVGFITNFLTRKAMLFSSNQQ